VPEPARPAGSDTPHPVRQDRTVPKPPPESTKTSLRQRLTAHARTRWPDLATVNVRYRGVYAYIDGQLANGTIQPLCRLRYSGSASIWGFAIYLASRAKYDDNFLPSGLPAGSPEEALDCACGLYLNNPTAWLQPPTTATSGSPDYRGEKIQRTELDAPANPNPIDIRPATQQDLPRIVEILNYTIENSHATFATQPTTVVERRTWFEQFVSTGPHRLIVAQHDSTVLGYACSQPYRDHEAFRETVEVSIALDVSCRGQGVGTALYRALLDILAAEPVHVIVAGIALPNDASIALHRKFGFTEVGIYRDYALKNGQYISSIWMQRLNDNTWHSTTRKR
jgi:phosphinothricin acetyltransferase